ncbi:MAG: class I SAM-dependent methyltransferase [Chloroflexi bacterium]|nr:class I SAM-dependent methyltransferase [Chloroflexota bacterium]
MPPSCAPSPGDSDYTAWMLAPVDPHAVYAALDAGCGNGTRTAALRRRLAPHALVTAVDLDRDAVRASGSIPGVDAARADISRLPHPDGSFDLVLAGHVLYYPSDPAGWLWEIRRVMSSRGMLLAATNSARSGRRLLDLHVDACRSAGKAAMAARALAPTARHRFTLENGADQLRRVFADVTVRWRDDPLVFDSVAGALAAYRAGLFARGAPARMSSADRERLADLLAPHMRASLMAAADAQGRIVIPRRSGCFTARG